MKIAVRKDSRVELNIKTAVQKSVRIFPKLLLGFYSLVCLYPLLWMVLYSFKNNNEIFSSNVFGLPSVWRVENYIKAWSKFNVVLYFKNSTVVAVLTVIITTLLAIMFAYATSRMKWKLSSAAYIYITTGMFIPVQIVIIPLLILLRNTLHVSNTYLAVVIPYVAFQLPFSTIVFHGFFRSIPNEIEEAAGIDGAGVYSTFFRIMLPLVKPAIATVSIFVFLFAWNELLMALILLTNSDLYTLPLGLINFQGDYQMSTDWGAMGAAMVISSFPTVIVYLFLSEQVEKAFNTGAAVKG